MARAYGESSRGIGNMMWNWRMLAATGEAKVRGFVIEPRALYNGINSGIAPGWTLIAIAIRWRFDLPMARQNRKRVVRTRPAVSRIWNALGLAARIILQTTPRRHLFHLYEHSDTRLAYRGGVGSESPPENKVAWDGRGNIILTPAEPN